jgi:hypothetical protein
MSQVDLLKSIYQAVYGDLSGPGRLSSLEELARALSKIAGKEPPWTARYLNSIILGHKGFSVTAELSQAIQVYAARLDEAHPLQALLVEITAYSINGRVRPGSIITGESKRCDCGVLFVPHHPRQKYCCAECPQRPRPRPVKKQEQRL